ncbi:MAG TPA: right-handed parallel beta-helix repeat-containing protein [Thermoanaerobaculia bacterium]|nr:right-handed parallel beta-helix repeat-containing protein [Thermoanaerobaculia bacterium]
MKALRLSFTVLAIVLLATSASAQATRTWVSGVGADDNPCSRTAPCKTFAGAHSKTAKNGIINAVDPGGFGAVTVGKSLTIDGGPFHAGLLASGTTGVIINITDFVADPLATVILRNLDIEGAVTGNRGVRILSAKKVIIENCRIFNFRGSPGTGVDVLTSVANVQIVLRNTTISNNLAQGVLVSGAAGNPTQLVMENSTVVQNGASAVDLLANAKATVSFSELSQNGSAGLFAEAGSTDADISFTRMQFNIIGVSSLNGAVVRLFNSQITHNNTSVSAAGVQSHGNNSVIGNNVNTLPAIIPAPTLQ